MLSEYRKKVDEEKKLKTKNKLLESAIEVFISNGYHKTKISDIVGKADVGQGTFYRNFKSKREIFEEILKKMIEELLTEFSEGALSFDNMPSSFEEYKNMSTLAFNKVIPVIKKNRNTMILFFRDAPTIDKEFKEEVDEFLQQFTEIAKYYLDYAIEKEYVRKCNSKIISESIIGMGVQLLKSWLDDKYSDYEIEEIMKEATNLVFLGLIK